MIWMGKIRRVIMGSCFVKWNRTVSIFVNVKGINTAFNTIAIIDADGAILGKYRKTHIPDGLPRIAPSASIIAIVLNAVFPAFS